MKKTNPARIQHLATLLSRSDCLFRGITARIGKVRVCLGELSNNSALVSTGERVKLGEASVYSALLNVCLEKMDVFSREMSVYLGKASVRMGNVSVC